LNQFNRENIQVFFFCNHLDLIGRRFCFYRYLADSGRYIRSFRLFVPQGLIGTIGAGLLLVCYALVFAVAVFNIKFYEPKPVVSIPEPEIKEEEKSNSIIPPVFVDDAGAHELEGIKSG
jgi:hypothetical protein